MRRQIIVIGPDARVRARLAQLVSRGGYRAEVAESIRQARRLDLHEIALAIVALERLGSEEAEEIDELRARLGTVLTVAPPGSLNVSGYDLVNADDEGGLLARVSKALAPTSEPEAVEMALEFAGYCLHLGGHSLVGPDDKEVPLTHSEFGLLCAFVQRPGRVLSRDQLMQLTAGRDAEAYDRSVDMQIMRVRRKIEPDPKRPSLIVTVPGSGYKFAAAVRRIEPATRPDQNPAAFPLEGRPSTPERRRITALAAELLPLEGSVLPDDPEELRKIIDLFRGHAGATLNRHGAPIVEGHGREIVAYFSFPFEQEDAAERALYAGLALARLPSEIEAQNLSGFAIRVGVSSGLVIAELGGEIVGEVPAHARRLCEMAERGQAILEAETRRQAGELFAYSYLGPVLIDGAGPSQVYEVKGPSAHSSRSEALFTAGKSELIGRDEELSRLLDEWCKAKAGNGRLFLVCGEAGIGKSRLVSALEERLAQASHASWRYFCSALHRDSSFHPVIARWKQEAGFTQGDSDKTQLEKLEALLAPENLASADFALIAALLSVPLGEDYPRVELTSRESKQRTFAVLLRRLASVASRAPVLMLVEDAQWADASSLELFDEVVDCIQELPLLVIVTYRPEFTPPWIGRAGVGLIALGRLDREQSGALVARASADRSIGREQQERIVARADGVPLFIECLTQAVIQDCEHPGEVELSTSIPASVHAMLVAPLDRFPVAKQIAQIGAAIGREFAHKLLAAVASLPDAQIAQGLDELIAAGLVTRRRNSSDPVYLFKHALIQEAAYSLLLREPRQTLHAKIAKALGNTFPTVGDNEPEILAHHCAEGGLTEEAVSWYLRAGKRAASISANAEAISQLNRGFSLATSIGEPEAQSRWRLQLSLALLTPLISIYGYASPELNTALDSLLQLSKFKPITREIFPVLYGRVTFEVATGFLDKALSHAWEALRHAKLLSDGEGTGIQRHSIGSLLLYRGRLRSATRILLTALPEFEEEKYTNSAYVYGQDHFVLVASYLAVSHWLLGSADEASQYAEKALQRARSLKHPNTLCLALTFAGGFLPAFCQNPEKVRIAASELIELASTHQLSIWLPTGTILLGQALVEMDCVEEGIEKMQTGVSTLERHHLRFGLPLWASWIASACVQSGQLDEGRAALARGWSVSKFGEHWMDAELHRLEGELLLADSDVAQINNVEQHFLMALKTGKKQCSRSLELRASNSLVQFYRSQGETEKANALLTSTSGDLTDRYRL